VLAVDYRNHASSDTDPEADVELRLGYATDVINAVLAIKRADLPRLDASRVGLLGRSMGGGVVLTALVVRPGLVDAAVVYSSVSSMAADNFDRWIRRDPGREGTAAAIAAAYGLPEEAPAFWREASPRPFFERVTEPVLVQHGTADDTCPVTWARATTKALERAGADVRLIEWEGAPHAFIAEWGASMDRTLEFLDARLRGQEGA
jgi:dipeptidyl aminopeptidase/acylaminoacyl peptidase